jgi:hypothetical protein
MLDSSDTSSPRSIHIPYSLSTSNDDDSNFQTSSGTIIPVTIKPSLKRPHPTDTINQSAGPTEKKA